MRRDEKQQIIESVTDLAKDARVIILTDFQGVTVEGMTDLRRRIRKAKGRYRVVKNTLACRALAEPAMEDFRKGVSGPTGFAFGFGDDGAVGVCKAIKEFAATNDKFKIKAGWLEGKPVTTREIVAFASLPSKDRVVAMLLGLMLSPVRNLVTVLSAPMRNLAMTVKAIADKRAAEESKNA